MSTTHVNISSLGCACMYMCVGGLSMELRASYMLGIYPIINPYPSTLLLKLSVSDSPHLQENGLLGVILYRIPLARRYLLHATVQIAQLL